MLSLAESKETQKVGLCQQPLRGAVDVSCAAAGRESGEGSREFYGARGCGGWGGRGETPRALYASLL